TCGDFFVGSAESRFEESPGALPRMALLENGTAGDQDLRTGPHNACYRVMVNAAVDFNPELQPLRLLKSCQRLNFFQARVNERLAAETRIHAHQQNVMNEWKNLVEYVDRRRRVYHYSGFTAVGNDEMKRAVKMGASFLMNRDPIDSCFGEHRNKLVRAFDH